MFQLLNTKQIYIKEINLLWYCSNTNHIYYRVIFFSTISNTVIIFFKF